MQKANQFSHDAHGNRRQEAPEMCSMKKIKAGFKKESTKVDPKMCDKQRVEQSCLPEHTDINRCRELTEGRELRGEKPFSFLRSNCLTGEHPYKRTMKN